MGQRADNIQPACARILIYGVTGSGKTTLAARLSAATGLPWHSVDDLTFEAEWVPVPDEEQRRRISAICDGSEWILDTAYGKWIDLPLSRANLVVALDYPRFLSLYRLVKRTFRRVIDRQPICNGNRETFRQMLSRDSIILWHFKSFERKRQRIRAWSSRTPGPHVLRFTRPSQVELWMVDFARNHR